MRKTSRKTAGKPPAKFTPDPSPITTRSDGRGTSGRRHKSVAQQLQESLQDNPAKFLRNGHGHHSLADYNPLGSSSDSEDNSLASVNSLDNSDILNSDMDDIAENDKANLDDSKEFDRIKAELIRKFSKESAKLDKAMVDQEKKRRDSDRLLQRESHRVAEERRAVRKKREKELEMIKSELELKKNKRKSLKSDSYDDTDRDRRASELSGRSGCRQDRANSCSVSGCSNAVYLSTPMDQHKKPQHWSKLTFASKPKNVAVGPQMFLAPQEIDPLRSGKQLPSFDDLTEAQFQASLISQCVTQKDLYFLKYVEMLFYKAFDHSWKDLKRAHFAVLNTKQVDDDLEWKNRRELEEIVDRILDKIQKSEMKDMAHKLKELQLKKQGGKQHGDAAAAAGKGGRKRDVCDYYNSPEGCNQDEAPHRDRSGALRLHVCKLCFQTKDTNGKPIEDGSHAAADCPNRK